MICLKSRREAAIIREASEKLKTLFFELKGMIRPGVTGIEINEKAECVIRAQGAQPAFKGYRGFPAAVCISIDEEVVHGIPSKRCLKENEIVSLDIGIRWKDFYSDAARTWPVADAEPEALKLIRVTRESFFSGFREMVPGKRLGDMSAAIQRHIESNGFSVVRDFVGHGIGRELHEDPQIPNFGDPGKGPKLEAGMVLAVEPMVNAGSWKVKVLDDQWTVVTQDGKRSAHYEDTVYIGEDGPENLTGEDAEPCGK